MELYMSQEKQSYTRQNYFIKKGFQIRFILKFCLLLLAGVVISTSLLLLFSQNTLTSTYQQSRLVIENTALAILPSIAYTSLITLVLLTIATIIVTLFISHKIAGPMFRFEKELREIGEGNLTKKVRLRSKDQAAELAECINDMTTDLREKIINFQNEVERILESARKQNAPEEIVEGLAHLHEELRNKLIT
jgi:methyl-accepting chemotaxis protein